MTVPGRRAALRGARGPSRPTDGGPAAVSAEVQADEFVSDLYQAHALALARVAKLLLGDQPSAEDVVQDAFLSLSQAQGPRPDPALPARRRHQPIALGTAGAAAGRAAQGAARAAHVLG